MNAAVQPVDDLVQPFQIEAPHLRGRLVRLGPAVDSILGRHDYPEPVAAMLGEALALASALSNMLKFDGVFTVQTKGDGPVPMLVADYRTPGLLRGYASVDEKALAAVGATPAGPVPRLLGAGYLAFTVDQGDKTERYQGIVELGGATLAECAQSYFRQSEQIGTGIRLAVARIEDESGVRRWRAGALMLQRLAAEDRAEVGDDEADDAWHRALLMLGSARDAELLDPALAPNDLLYRLFHEDGVRVWAPQPLGVGCTCSRERVERVLRSFAPAEMADMVVDGRISARCEFCTATYDFAAEELGI
jgi:molecular chaperone Hsp33